MTVIMLGDGPDAIVINGAGELVWAEQGAGYYQTDCGGFLTDGVNALFADPIAA